MANTKSAIKRIRTSEKRRLRNQSVRSSSRTYVKKARAAIADNATEALSDVVAAISALDRAAKKGVIHRNNAARRKSRLMKAFNAAQPAPAMAEGAAPAKEAPKPKRGRTTKKAEAAAEPKRPRTRAKKSE